MSMHGAPPCTICGAHGDYCTLDTASGVSIDCRDLRLREPEDLVLWQALAANLREQSHDDAGTIT